MEAKVFYSCHSSDDHIPSSNPIVIDKYTAVSVALQILREPDDFIGFIDSNERVLQVRFEESEQLWVEHPSPKHGGSFGKFIPYSELEALVINLPEKLHKMCLPGLVFQSW
ncbi:hypothetical protein INR79_09120 [Vibrio sp. SCSIO 43132]|uniref:hypothetical protein n=1 Tax=Vibrio sp. SCSIO 43132 TaxID=2779363 RepID=UPI001CA9BBBD|nr:hypothetical protein [Vibrio sp. SCSIO 43132]UAB68713.1 hypothetical protein INR79_09120 [Vibrio sp. SCSIO 43132]